MLATADARQYCPSCRAVFRTGFTRCPLDGAELSLLDGDPLVGAELDGRYVIEDCIGEGGMGRVYRARHKRMSRTYAIKVLFGDHAGDSRMRARFAREAEAVSRLGHPNVISILDFGETDAGLLYIVMDLAVGGSLAQAIADHGPLPFERCGAILEQLCRGLAHAHDRGLIHRDFKGENVILVVEHGTEVAKIVDFGICMIVEDQAAATMLTSQGIVMGTPAMMAPEQACGDVVDQRSDLFSLGVVLYQMLAGRLPFDGTPLEIARKNLYERAPTIRERTGFEVDPVLERIALRLMEKRPEHRFQSAHEVLGELSLLREMPSGDSWERVSSGAHLLRPITAAEATVAAQTMELGTSRRRKVVGLSILGLAMAAGLTALLVTRAGDARGGEALAERSAPAIVEPDQAVPDGEANTSADDDNAGARLSDDAVDPAATERDGDSAATERDGDETAATERDGDEAAATERDGDEAAAAPDSHQAAATERDVATAHADTAAPDPEPTHAQRDRTARRRSADRRRQRNEAARRALQRKAESAEADEPDDVASLQRSIEAVSRSLERLQQSKGRAAAEPYVELFRRINYTRAFSAPALRPATIRRLDGLRRQIESEHRR